MSFTQRPQAIVKLNIAFPKQILQKWVLQQGHLEKMQKAKTLFCERCRILWFLRYETTLLINLIDNWTGSALKFRSAPAFASIVVDIVLAMRVMDAAREHVHLLVCEWHVNLFCYWFLLCQVVVYCCCSSFFCCVLLLPYCICCFCCC